MNKTHLRKCAADLARECRSIPRVAEWSIREWNNKVRITVKHYMQNVERFHRVHGTWEE